MANKKANKTNIETKTGLISKIKSFVKKVWSMKYTMYVCVGIFVFMLAIILLMVTSNGKVVMTIDGEKYYEKDFNMYAYLTKIDAFGINGLNLTEDNLNTQLSADSDRTIRDYIKDMTVEKIKVIGAIKRIAADYSITLTDEDYEIIRKNKEAFINSFSSKGEFNKSLKKNHTDEASYDKALASNQLYQKVYDELYAEGKLYDLTTEERLIAVKSYYKDYVKIKQIVFLKKDYETGNSLTPDEVLKKQVFANDLLEKIRSNKKINFDDYIVEFSETDKNVDGEYYLLDNLDSAIKTAVSKLENGEVSSVISTQYAFHIVKREVLDEAMLEDYLLDKRNDKLAGDITSYLEKIKIVKSDYLEKVTIR